MAAENLVIRISATGGAQVSRESAKGAAGLRGLGTAVEGADRRTRAWSAATAKQRESLQGLGRVTKAAAIGGVIALAAGIGHVIKTGADYEKEMARVQGVSQATDRQMGSLNKTALRLGRETKYSAAEAAEGMYELSSAGFSVREMTKTIPGTMSLAAASNIELADAAEISSNALRGFGLPASQSARVADVLAESVNQSSLEMRDLQMSLKYVGPVAKATGQDFETVVAALGLMGDAGIKGEQAGTTVRAALLSLTNPIGQTAKGLNAIGLESADLQGPKGLKPLPVIIAALNKATAGMSQSARNAAISQIFGREAASGMFAIMAAGPAKLNAVSKALDRSDGAAKKAARTMNDTVPGAWENFLGTIETTEIQLYQQFQEPLKNAILDATKIVNTQGVELQRSLDQMMATPEFKQADLGQKVSMIADIIGDQWKKSGFGPKLEDALVDALDWVVPKVAEGGAKLGISVAGALVTGFAKADVWGKLAIASWLFSKLGGFAALRASGVLAGTQVATGMSTGIAGGMSTFNLAQSFGRGKMASSVAAAGYTGRAIAGGLMSSVARAIPVLATTYAVGDVASTAIAGDTKDALIKGGAGLVGGGIGFLVGGPVGAAIGGGIGVGLSGAISGMFGGKDSPTKALKSRIREDMDRIVEMVRSRSGLIGNLSASSQKVIAARNRETKAAHQVKKAEREAIATRRRYGANSIQAARANAKLAVAIDDTRKATRRAERAERLHGVQRKATKVVMRAQVREYKDVIERQRENLSETRKQIRATPKTASNAKLLERLLSNENRQSKGLNTTKIELNKTIEKSSQQIGSKFAKALRKVDSTSEATTKSLNRQRTTTKNLRQSWLDITPAWEKVGRTSKTEFGKSKTAIKGFGDAAAANRRKVNENVRAMPPVQIEATGLMIDDFNAKKSAIDGSGKPRVKKRFGGALRQFMRAGGGLVPAAVSPGELLDYKGQRMIVPGRPEPRDSVFMDLPVDTKVFTFDGQRMLAEGRSESTALNQQRAHFAGGGIAKPTIEGGSTSARGLGQKAIDTLHGDATDKLEDLRKKARETAASLGGTRGPDGIGTYGGLPMANWVIEALKYAASKGVAPAPTSGYRSHAYNVSQGRNYFSEHEGTQYPHGAVDFGGYTTGYEAAQSVIAATADFKYPLLSYISSFDKGHTSGTGHRRGGIIRALQAFGAGGGVKGIWAGTSIDKTYATSDGFSGEVVKPYVIKALAEWAGLPGVTMEQITRGESTGHAGMDISDPPGRSRGLYAINDTWHDGSSRMRNPILNTLEAKKIVGGGLPNANIWHGSGHVTGWDLHYDGDPAAIARHIGGDGGGDTGPTKKEKAAAKRKKRIDKRMGAINKLRADVGEAKTRQGRQTALWKLVERWGMYGDFSKDEKAHVIERVRKAAGSVDPLGNISTLQNLAGYLRSKGKVSGEEELGDNFVERIRKVSDKSGSRAKDRRKAILKKVRERGLGYPLKGALKGNDRLLERYAEEVQIAEDRGSAESGPGGSDLTDAEVLEQILRVDTQYDTMKDRRRLLTRSLGYIDRYQANVTKMIAAARRSKRRGSKYVEGIEGPGGRKTIPRWKIPAYEKSLVNSRTTEGDLREHLKDLVGTTGRGGELLATKLKLDDLRGPKSTESDAGTDDSGTIDLLRQQVTDLQRQIALRGSNDFVVDDWLKDIKREIPPFAGFFSQGGIVPGPPGAPRRAIVHGGEKITPSGKSAAPVVNVSVDWSGRYVEVETIAEDVIRKQLFRAGSPKPQRGRPA